ncbi:MAG: hypothetical protein WAW39_01130 [Prosthecobacter sp.]|uniref:hypothetical protein n=1 Tax=Prosthecobacter sp. TaxID=1965333 RepID=UPI003BB18D39
MIVFLHTLLRWWVGLRLPFTSWRVSVQELCGTSRVSGQEVRMLAAGMPRWAAQVGPYFFAGEPVVEKTTQVPVWQLRRHLNQRQASADLTLVGIDRISARLFLGKDFLAMPPLISTWQSVPENASDFSLKRSSVASDLRRVKKQGYTSQLSKAAGDFDLFYEHFYKPYILGRHTTNARLTPRWMLRLVYAFGFIQWLTLNGERVAADLVMKQGRGYNLVVTGVKDGRQDLLRQGALAALYVHSLDHARQLGCTRILLGSSRAFLQDGLTRYKGKWMHGFNQDDGHITANHVLLLRWNRLAGPVAEFLSSAGPIHHEQSGYSALWAFPSHLPLSAETLQKQYDVLKLKDLYRFRILLPGKAPPGFVCPPEVRLIELAAAEKAGAGGIIGLG